MGRQYPVLVTATLALLAGCSDNRDEASSATLTADEAAQLNEAAEMLDASNAAPPPSNRIVP